jgi:hypothetical protein
LFLVPLLVAAIMVAVWLLFSWLARAGTDPADLVRDLQAADHGSWQKAYTLADLLRDPGHEQLKRDAGIADALAETLQREIREASLEKDRVRLRVFLCRALGEFQVAVVLPALAEAAVRERDPVEIEVRRAAVEAIAVLAAHLGPEALRSDVRLLDAVVLASDNPNRPLDGEQDRGMLRAASAFALGVIGGSRARQRLLQLLEDPVANVRYNAATGLARHGETAAVPVLLEMLDPENPYVVENEETVDGREWKRAVVTVNALRAVRQLMRINPAADLGEFESTIRHLVSAEVPPGVRTEAHRTLQALKSMPAP